MADKKEKRIRYTSPAGIASWPKLNTPDAKYGHYGVKLLLDPNDPRTPPFLAFLDAETDKAVIAMKEEKGAKLAKTMERGAAYEDEMDTDGNETGKVVVNFTMPSVIERKSDGKKWTLKPALFDAKGTPLAADVEIGGGSLIKVSFELSPYYVASSKKAGVSRRMVAVQVLDLKQWSGNSDASSFGFESEEGFSAADEAIAGASGPVEF